MAHPSPLNEQHQQAEASFLYYGAGQDGAEVVETFGEVEAEYAAIRKATALLDVPQTAAVRVEGDDRTAFLNNMLTAPVADLKPYRTTPAFWLNRKGRIDADLRVIQRDDHTLLITDILAAERLLTTLNAFIIADDVQLTDVTDRTHRLELHGPRALPLLLHAAEHHSGPPLAELHQGLATNLRIADADVLVERHDTAGETGLNLYTHAEHAQDLYRTLLETGANGGADSQGTPFRLKTAGWHAFNIARIEAGTPLYLLDFGPDSLPHETGVLNDRVSFEKGCYLGQEVVARMQSLGHPKQTLVGLRVHGAQPDPAWQPTTGARVLAPDADTPVGAVTSSTRSPMLADAAICFAQVAYAHTPPGTRLRVETSAGPADAEVNPQLAFWTKPA